MSESDPLAIFSPGAFRRFDEDDDRAFYSFPRRVVHIDEGAIAALTALYDELVPPTGCVLDLMSSWRSHLPARFSGRLVGLGMNREEMTDNPQLGEIVVHDLNRQPGLPFADEAFDAALCAVSVQYLTRPVEVFGEVRRVLRPGAPFVVTFSNRCFPDKAVALWHAASDAQHVPIVMAYFGASHEATSQWCEVRQRVRIPREGDPLYALWAFKAPSAAPC